ncbi:MAG: hypothetical protein PF541_06380 [Prolixibacteraceae bacterium]|nr:hypothetical protein [Prolixibacteraceae bacterium]
MTKDQFIAFVKAPGLLDQHSLLGLKEIIQDYPYFSLARMLYLRNLRNINSYKFEAELAAHAFFIADRTKLYVLLSESYKAENEFQLLPFDKDAFDNFFNKNTVPNVDELELPQTIAFELIDESQQNEQEPIDLIERFIIENPTIKVADNKKPGLNNDVEQTESLLDDGLITETLAGVYMQQGLYLEALKAYEKLSLKFPEKNSYFATQIEKIKELISK